MTIGIDSETNDRLDLNTLILLEVFPECGGFFVARLLLPVEFSLLWSAEARLESDPARFPHASSNRSEILGGDPETVEGSGRLGTGAQAAPDGPRAAGSAAVPGARPGPVRGSGVLAFGSGVTALVSGVPVFVNGLVALGWATPGPSGSRRPGAAATATRRA